MLCPPIARDITVLKSYLVFDFQLLLVNKVLLEVYYFVL